MTRSLRHSGGFRMVQLNATGWLALLVAPTLVGAVIARVVDRRWWLGAVGGALAAWSVALVVDLRSWRSSSISIGCPDVSHDVLDRVVVELRRHGVDAVLEFDGSPRADAGRWLVRTTMRHRDEVAVRLARVSDAP